MTPDHRLLRDLALGRGTVDRAAHRRADDGWWRAAQRDPATRVLLLRDGRTPVVHADDGSARLALVAPAEVPDDAAVTLLLGVEPDGTAVLAAALPDTEPRPDGPPPPSAAPRAEPGATVWRDLRAAGAALDDHDAGLLVTAVALDAWHRTHTRCPRCGAPTEVAAAGWHRVCPDDGSEHYPRTDPAVIVLVRDDDDRALLGRQKRWPPGWYSTLAGFVEAGETAEAAVRREVLEESGVRIGDDPDDVVYLGSQPWPFPASLMLGYHARAASTEVDVDGEEIEQAEWFTREELAEACASGRVRLPPSVSIARRLVERWYGGPLPHDWSRG